MKCDSSGGICTEDSIRRYSDTLYSIQSCSWCVSVCWLQWAVCPSTRGSWGWIYEERNLFNSTRQAYNDPSNETLFFLFLFLPWKHEAEGDVVVVARFHAASSCLQVSSLYWRLASKITSIFLVLWSKFFELSDGLRYFLFLKYTLSVLKSLM